MTIEPRLKYVGLNIILINAFLFFCGWGVTFQPYLHSPQIPQFVFILPLFCGMNFNHDWQPPKTL